MKTDEESTEEFEAAALRESIERARGTPQSFQAARENERETARVKRPDGLLDALRNDATDAEEEEERTVLASAVRAPRFAGAPVEDLADVEDVEDLDDDESRRPSSRHPASLMGTMPGHDVAQALRQMMGEVPDDVPPRDDLPPLDEGDTQTRLPDGYGPQTVQNQLYPPTARERTDSEALPAFSLDDDPLEDSSQHVWRRPNAIDLESTGITRDNPAMARDAIAAFQSEAYSTAEVESLRPGAMSHDELPRFTFASVPEASDPNAAVSTLDGDGLSAELPRLDSSMPASSTYGMLADGGLPETSLFAPETVLEPADALRMSAFGDGATSVPATIGSAREDLPLSELRGEAAGDSPKGRLTALSIEIQVGSAPSIEISTIDNDFPTHARSPSEVSIDTSAFEDPPVRVVRDAGAPPILDLRGMLGPRSSERYDDDYETDAPAPEDDANAFVEEATAAEVAVVPPPEPMEEAMIEELIPEELVLNELPADQQQVPAPDDTEGKLKGSKPPPVFRPAPVKEREPAYVENADAEEIELVGSGSFGALLALYQQRLAQTQGPNKRAALFVKMASVYETAMNDSNEAYQTLLHAFELAPLNEDVVAAIDRVTKEAARVGELADHVKKNLLPGAPDDKRVAYLGHLVYWYERVLGRGNEVNTFVSDIERQDRVHPVVLKRAAQLAAMNADTKTQREHLHRALERTVRREERVALHIALASAYAGTPDAMKHYEHVLELDPTSIVALQGVKRLGKEQEKYEQVQWALERQSEVAPTEAERIDALLELAELQESKYLKREAAAELLERVVAMEPSHPAALKALERCYHALRDWPKLARILEVRSEHTFDKRAKVELLELAAEVHDSKLGDSAGAIDVYKSLLVVEPKHRRALTDLSRVYEKLGDWANVANYKARLAELAPSKRSSSQELVKLGDFLNTPERDSIAAKLQYERAAEVDPTNAAAWEALQKIAAAAGDEARVIECLEQRKKHTDVPRQRAVVLVELANVHLAKGDDEAARKCFEAASRADSSNEAAAVAMLDTYTLEERWAEAAPLCELLVNAAIRDRDGEALFLRLRLATRIAAALGDVDRAVASAMAALDARPKDPGAQTDLIEVCAQAPASVTRAREHILRIAESPAALANDVLVRLASLQREIGDYDGAGTTYELARTRMPEDVAIQKALAEVYLLQGDFPRACKLKVDMARNATAVEARFDLLIEAGEIWARRAMELEKAAATFEEARAIKPLDTWLLETLMWLYGELGEWARVVGVLEDVAQTQKSPTDKIKTLLTMAEVVKDKLGDRLRAVELFDEVLDIDRSKLGAFEDLVRTLTEMKGWERLERSYRKMIARVKDDGDPALQFALFHQLGLIYRDRLGDASRAYDALDAASRIRPDDNEVRKIVIELLIVTDNLDNAATRLRDEIERRPLDPELYAELYDIFLRQHSFDKAWCVVNVLCRMTEKQPTAEQLRFHEDYSPMPLDRIPGQIVEQAWRSHIFHADLEDALTRLFAVMTPAMTRMRYNQLRPEQRVGRPFTPTHSRMHDAIRITFNNASEILAAPPPDLLLGEPKSTIAFSPALAPYGAVRVAVPQIESQAASLVYLVGKHLALQRTELAAFAFFPTLAELESLLATALRVARNEAAKDPANAALDASFAATISPPERESIRNIVVQATTDGAALDVQRWMETADLSSMRAGLLLSGDVEQARAAIVASGASDALIGELYKFATSDLYADLRGAIGVAVHA